LVLVSCVGVGGMCYGYCRVLELVLCVGIESRCWCRCLSVRMLGKGAGDLKPQRGMLRAHCRHCRSHVGAHSSTVGKKVTMIKTRAPTY
jgi:hypothetical protein